MRALGATLLVAGVGVLGYLGWQLYGTNVLAQREQRAVVEEVTRVWAEPRSPESDSSAAEEPARALLRIPAFGEDWVMPVLAGVEEDALARGVGHFEGSAAPGEVGNVALAGHRVTHGEPFADLPSLEPGDLVLVETRTHLHTYELLTGGDDLVVDHEDVWVVDPLPTNPDPGGVQPPQDGDVPLITLTTCAELFHTDERLVAFGRLVDSRAKQGGS